ncbi:hypothetical protein V6N13_024267 [Hibiscus sabdariffa]|uniref:Uncharacterized protein n=1 Tax=Hibiscus sabdariffa TaxID=183260 RepID=A0ABR2BWZ7_9ROSI
MLNKEEEKNIFLQRNDEQRGKLKAYLGSKGKETTLLQDLVFSYGFRVGLLSKHSLQAEKRIESWLYIAIFQHQHVLAVRYGSVIFFYPPDNASSDTSQKSRSLENSLSQILLHFYPLAGQLTDPVTIECNDERACFVEAKSRCRLKELLANPDPELLKDLVPSTDPKAICSTLACILLVQLTSFACGGTAVAILLN